MAEVFNWIRPGYELVKVNFDWNIQVPFLQTTDGNGGQIDSSFFSPKETPDRQWKLRLMNQNTKISIHARNYNNSGQTITMPDPVLVKMSLLDGKGRKILQQMVKSQLNYNHVEFFLTKEDIIQSQCQQADGSYTFCCTILSHVKNETVSPRHHPAVDINCSEGLLTHLEKLFDNMQLSDVTFNVGGLEFPAHKNILAARSNVFADMFEHPTKEKLTNQITIEDVEPDVFQELLRFIYTGRVTLDKLETMAARLFIAADKYLLDELKSECEKCLLHQMSPENCIVLLLHGDLLKLNPSEHLKEAAKFFRRYPSQVMATDGWKKMKQENPASLCDIQEFVYRYK